MPKLRGEVTHKLRLLLVLAAGVIVGVLFDRLVLKDYWFNSAEWGNVADWVGGVGTAAAVGVAAVQLLRERTREEHAERMFRESMARSVFASAPVVVKGDGGRHLHCSVDNDSDFPVFELQVDFVGRAFKRNVRVGLLGSHKQVLVDSGALVGLHGGEGVAVHLRFIDAYGTAWGSEGGRVERLTGSSLHGGDVEIDP